MAKLAKQETFDLVWRMHPYHGGCPTAPKTYGQPLVVGPLFYGWPVTKGGGSPESRPRFGIGIRELVAPVANRGWQDTMNKAALIMCATNKHVDLISGHFPKKNVIELPVIVNYPPDREPKSEPERNGVLRLVFHCQPGLK